MGKEIVGKKYRSGRAVRQNSPRAASQREQNFPIGSDKG